jgi:thioredoxin reductase (NADPH)
MHKTDVLVIGAGPVGLFTVFQAGMLGMKCHVVDNLDMVGGQCSALYPEKPIYDIPAYAEITAANLIKNLCAQNEKFKPEYHLEQQVENVTNDGKSFHAITSKGVEIQSKIVIIAAGAGSFTPNRPPLENLEQYENKSVFYLVKNMEDFRGKKIAIAGGGDSAIDWAINLANIAEKIYLIHRREKFRAAPESLNQIAELEKQGKIELVVPYQLHKLEGTNGILEKVIVADLDGNEKALDANILLPFFGLATDLGPIKNWGIGLEHFHVNVNQSSSETNIPGVYAVGDVAHYPGKVKLILVGFSEAALALHHAYERVFDGKALHFEYSTTKGAKGL